MAYTVKLTPASTGTQGDISSIVQWPTIQVNLQLTKQVSTMTFQISVTAARTMPLVGDTIDFYDGATHVFGGKITDADKNITGGLLSGITYTVTDWSFDLDKKVVVKSYTNMDAGNIVKDIITNYCTGFTSVNTLLAGYTIPSISFSYQPVSKCLQKIAQLIGWDWYVDPSKDVHFFNSDVKPAAFNLTDTSGNYNVGTLDVDTSIQNLKNSVFVIGGNYLHTYTNVTTPDIYKTDGTSLIFPLAYSYDPASIAVTLAGASQTVGIDQKDNPASFNVLYNAGQNNVGAFLRFPTAPTTGQTLNTSGNASIPVLGHYSNGASVTTYGEYQDSVVDKLINSVAEAQNRAKAEVAIYGVPSVTLNFVTQVAGLMTGTTITLSSTAFGIAAQTFTIQTIQISALTPTTLAYSVSAVSTDNVTFTDIMTLLLEAELMQNGVATSTTLEVLIGVAEALTIAETNLIVTTSSGPYLWGTAVWGFFTWGP